MKSLEEEIMAQKTVTTFAELKSAIEDSTTTEIRLANDIVFSSGGIQIPRNKGNISIDGAGHTITDYNSGAYTDTIYFPPSAGAAVTATIKNAVWNGRNYYGVLCVYDSANNNNVTTVLDNIKYKGPQFVYNRNGITRIKNCTVSIEKNGSVGNSQELCEGNRIIIEGKVSVTSQTSSTSVMWFPYAGSAFTVEEGASFTLQALSTYMWYTDTAAKPVMIFKKNSLTELTVKSGLFYSYGTGAHIASSFTLEKGASFKAVSSAGGGVPIFKCAGAFSMDSGSSFQLISPNSGSSPLMYFANTATLTFQSPKSVLLYDNGANIFSFQSGSSAAPNTLNITAKMINLWTAAKTPYASAGGFDDKPASAFFKSGYASEITATVTASSSAVLGVKTNIVSGDNGYPMNASTFNILNAKVLSMGDIDLAISAVTDISDAVTGTTAPSAAVRAVYPTQTLTGTAAETGSYTLPLPARLAVDTKVTVSANRYFLTKSLSTVVTGSVSVTHLTDLEFYGFAVPYHRSIVKRIDPDWYIEVTDTRKGGGDWYLYASLKLPLQSENRQLDNVLTFYENGIKQILSDTPVLIKHGVSASVPAVTRVSWTEAEGLLLTVLPEYLYASGHYTANISWFVRTSEL